MMPKPAALLIAPLLALLVLPVSSMAGASARRPAAMPAALRARLGSGGVGGTQLVRLKALRLFYGGRGHRPAWFSGDRPSPQIDGLVETLRSADSEGLDPADYHLDEIDALRRRLRERPGPTGKAADTVDLDLLLSDAFFIFAGHLTSGRVDPESIEPEWNIRGRSRALAPLLAAALERGRVAKTLAGMAPAREDYRRLRAALASQRAAVAAGGWPHVPPGPALREGDRDPRVAALRSRLAATGELPAAMARGDLFDAELVGAVQRFQARHGLEADGVVGSRTLAALAVTARQRARQVEANLERLRWLPDDIGPRHLVVNIPDFRLTLTEEARPTLSMRVVAGRQTRRTPFFTGEITSIVVNPPWMVPARIAFEDKLPQILDDRDVFAAEGLKVFAKAGKGWRRIDPAEVDWARIPSGRFPYRLLQAPGPRNALGRLKFLVPNRHDIYLHDTPSRGLFARAERAFSSGCIRVERAVDLAARLLAPDAAWSRERIEAAIAAGRTVDVPLRRPMPVYLLYATAWVDPDGSVQFREDVYDRDAALLEALARPLVPR